MMLIMTQLRMQGINAFGDKSEEIPDILKSDHTVLDKLNNNVSAVVVGFADFTYSKVALAQWYSNIDLT